MKFIESGLAKLKVEECAARRQARIDSGQGAFSYLYPYPLSHAQPHSDSDSDSDSTGSEDARCETVLNEHCERPTCCTRAGAGASSAVWLNAE